MYTLFQKNSKNDSSYNCATTDTAVAVNASNKILTFTPEKEILQRFAHDVAAELPELAHQTCFVCHAKDKDSENIAQRLGTNLENAGISVRLDSNYMRENRERAEYLHELVNENCDNVIFISQSEFLQRCEEYSKNQISRQKNDPLNLLENKQFRYAFKVSKKGVSIFEVQLDDCGDALTKLLKTQPDERFYFYQFPERITLLQLIRTIYSLPQQGKLYRSLKEQLNNVDSNDLIKRPQPEIDSFKLPAPAA